MLGYESTDHAGPLIIYTYRVDTSTGNRKLESVELVLSYKGVGKIYRKWGRSGRQRGGYLFGLLTSTVCHLGTAQYLWQYGTGKFGTGPPVTFYFFLWHKIQFFIDITLIMEIFWY